MIFTWPRLQRSWMPRTGTRAAPCTWLRRWDMSRWFSGSCRRPTGKPIGKPMEIPVPWKYHVNIMWIEFRNALRWRPWPWIKTARPRLSPVNHLDGIRLEWEYHGEWCILFILFFLDLMFVCLRDVYCFFLQCRVYSWLRKGCTRT